MFETHIYCDELVKEITRKKSMHALGHGLLINSSVKPATKS